MRAIRELTRAVTPAPAPAPVQKSVGGPSEPTRAPSMARKDTESAESADHKDETRGDEERRDIGKLEGAEKMASDALTELRTMHETFKKIEQFAAYFNESELRNLGEKIQDASSVYYKLYQHQGVLTVEQLEKAKRSGSQNAFWETYDKAMAIARNMRILTHMLKQQHFTVRTKLIRLKDEAFEPIWAIVKGTRKVTKELEEQAHELAAAYKREQEVFRAKWMPDQEIPLLEKAHAIKQAVERTTSLNNTKLEKLLNDAYNDVKTMHDTFDLVASFLTEGEKNYLTENIDEAEQIYHAMCALKEVANPENFRKTCAEIQERANTLQNLRDTVKQAAAHKNVAKTGSALEELERKIGEVFERASGDDDYGRHLAVAASVMYIQLKANPNEEETRKYLEELMLAETNPGKRANLIANSKQAFVRIDNESFLTVEACIRHLTDEVDKTEEFKQVAQLALHADNELEKAIASCEVTVQELGALLHKYTTNQNRYYVTTSLRGVETYIERETERAQEAKTKTSDMLAYLYDVGGQAVENSLDNIQLLVDSNSHLQSDWEIKENSIGKDTATAQKHDACRDTRLSMSDSLNKAQTYIESVRNLNTHGKMRSGSNATKIQYVREIKRMKAEFEDLTKQYDAAFQNLQRSAVPPAAAAPAGALRVVVCADKANAEIELLENIPLPCETVYAENGWVRNAAVAAYYDKNIEVKKAKNKLLSAVRELEQSDLERSDKPDVKSIVAILRVTDKGRIATRHDVTYHGDTIAFTTYSNSSYIALVYAPEHTVLVDAEKREPAFFSVTLVPATLAHDANKQITRDDYCAGTKGDRLRAESMYLCHQKVLRFALLEHERRKPYGHEIKGDYDRVFVTSDIHADLRKFVQVLLACGLITIGEYKHEQIYENDTNIYEIVWEATWAAQSTLLVICGDLIDGKGGGGTGDARGSYEFLLHCLLFNLRIQARSLHSDVLFTIGNHDAATVTAYPPYQLVGSLDMYVEQSHFDFATSFASFEPAEPLKGLMLGRHKMLMPFYACSPYLMLTFRNVAFAHAGFVDKHSTGVFAACKEKQKQIDDAVLDVTNLGEFLAPTAGARVIFARGYAELEHDKACDYDNDAHKRFSLIAVGHCVTHDHSGYGQLKPLLEQQCDKNITGEHGCVLTRDCRRNGSGPLIALVDTGMSASFRDPTKISMNKERKVGMLLLHKEKQDSEHLHTVDSYYVYRIRAMREMQFLLNDGKERTTSFGRKRHSRSYV